jgi:hypothetical protein
MAAAEGSQARMVGLQHRQKFVEVVGFGDRNSQFFQQGLQVFLGTLLAMKADQVMQRGSLPRETSGTAEIGLGLLYPLAGRLFHTEFSPST